MRRPALIFAIVAILLTPAVWNLAVTAYEHAHNPLPGKFYEVENLRMYLYCTGAGAQTVVIEAGASASWLAWNHVQQLLSKTSRVCTYDRNGHGWSDPARDPRDAATIARKLHELLGEAQVPRVGARQAQLCPSMSAGFYRHGTGASVPQQPHTEDEIYFVIAGRGKIAIAGADHEVSPKRSKFLSYSRRPKALFQ